MDKTLELSMVLFLFNFIFKKILEPSNMVGRRSCSLEYLILGWQLIQKVLTSAAVITLPSILLSCLLKMDGLSQELFECFSFFVFPSATSHTHSFPCSQLYLLLGWCVCGGGGQMSNPNKNLMKLTRTFLPT